MCSLRHGLRSSGITVNRVNGIFNTFSYGRQEDMSTWTVNCRSSVNWGALTRFWEWLPEGRLVIRNLPLRLLYPTVVLRQWNQKTLRKANFIREKEKIFLIPPLWSFKQMLITSPLGC